MLQKLGVRGRKGRNERTGKISRPGGRAGVPGADPPGRMHTREQRRRPCIWRTEKPPRRPLATRGGDPAGTVWRRVSAYPTQLTPYFLPLVETASLSLFPATEFMVAFPEESV